MELQAKLLHTIQEEEILPVGSTVPVKLDVRRNFDYYDWPGNVRELSNVIERGVITAPGSVISVQQLPESFFSIDNIDTRKRFVGGSLEEEIASFTADLVRRTYESHPSSRKLAEALSISQTKANRLIAKYITAK